MGSRRAAALEDVKGLTSTSLGLGVLILGIIPVLIWGILILIGHWFLNLIRRARGKQS